MTDSSPRRAGVTTMVRLAIWTAPAAGALKLIGNLGTFNSVGYGIPQPTEAAIAAGPGYLLGQLVGTITPTVLTPFWAFALLAYLTPLVRARRILAAAVISWVVGAGFALAALGVITYAIPALAQAYQAGPATTMNVADSFFTWPRVAMFYPAVLVPIGSVVFALAVWRATALPRPAVLGFVLASILISVPGPIHTLHLAGGILTLGSGLWIAHTVRLSASQAPAPEL
jgi:hypothetical protein